MLIQPDFIIIIIDSAHPAAVIKSLLIFCLSDIDDYMSVVLSHHDAMGTSATIILAVLFPFTITGIAVFIILQHPINL